MFPQVRGVNNHVLTAWSFRVSSPLFPIGPFDVSPRFRNAQGMARPDEEARQAVGRAVEARMGQLRLSPISLATAAEIGDAQTVRDLLSGERWPRAGTRWRLEDALEWERGTLQAMAAGVYDGPADVDPVERAIEGSNLTRANKAKLLGMYYELLDGQGEGVRGA